MDRIDRTILEHAATLGVEIEFKGPWCREYGDPGWVRRKSLYQRLYRKLMKMQRGDTP